MNMDKFVYGLAGSVVSGDATRQEVLEKHARTITEEELDAAILDLGQGVGKVDWHNCEGRIGRAEMPAELA